VRREVADVALHEDGPGGQAHDLVGRHARVGAADPEVAGPLARCHLAEEAGVRGGAARGPAAEGGSRFLKEGERSRIFFWGGGLSERAEGKRGKDFRKRKLVVAKSFFVFSI